MSPSRNQTPSGDLLNGVGLRTAAGYEERGEEQCGESGAEREAMVHVRNIVSQRRCLNPGMA